MAKKKTITSSQDVVSIPEAEDAMRRWIPVEERLPDVDHSYQMVYDDDGDRAWCYLASGFDSLGNEITYWHKEGGATYVGRVTHWLEIGPPDDEDNV